MFTAIRYLTSRLAALGEGRARTAARPAAHPATHSAARLTSRLAVLLAGLALAGCVCENGECPPEPEGRQIVMSFRLLTRDAGSATRATVIGQEDGTAAENWVDPGTVRFLLLTDGGVLLQNLSGEFQRAETVTDYSSYIVRKVTFREPYFDYAAVGGRVRFRIMVLANWPDNALKEIADCRSQAEIEQIAATNSQALYNMNSDMQKVAPVTDFEPLLPAPDNGNGGQGLGIPMYGLKSFDVAQEDLYDSTPEQPYDITSSGADPIHLLRALAKIEVIDAIQSKNEGGYPKVIGAKLLKGSYRYNARLIPDNFADGRQVTAASLNNTNPNTATDDLDFIVRNYATINPPVDQYPDGGDAFHVSHTGFVAYLPEMPIPTADVLQVTVENGPQADLPADTPLTAEYSIPIPSPAEWGSEVLRNHIYRIKVTGATTDLNMEYTYTICPWNEQSTEITFN